MLAPWKKSYDQPRQHIKKQRHYFADKSLSRQSYCFSSSHVWMWELDYKKKLSTEELMLLNCGVGEDSWESLGQQGDQSWVFIGRTDAATEAPILWPPDAKNWLIWKDPYAGKRLKAGGKGGDRGWDSWMASLTQWTWVWVGSGGWRWTRKPGVLESMG